MAIELFGKATGAYEAVFSNDLDNFKYDSFDKFDAVFLNNTVGQIFVDPEIRAGFSRFVREGGGLAGYHGTSHASMDWPEFGEMLGAVEGSHREPTEIATVKIDDPASPLVAAFGGKSFVHQDEFYRFVEPPLSRNKVRVLMSMDIERTDLNQGRGCGRPCVRPDCATTRSAGSTTTAKGVCFSPPWDTRRHSSHRRISATSSSEAFSSSSAISRPTRHRGDYPAVRFNAAAHHAAGARCLVGPHHAGVGTGPFS